LFAAPWNPVARFGYAAAFMALHFPARSSLLLVSCWLTSCGENTAATPSSITSTEETSDAAAPTSGAVDTSRAPSDNDATSAPNATESSDAGAVVTTLDPTSHEDSGGGQDAAADDNPSDAGNTPSTTVVLPPVNAGLDYQLGGSYTAPDGVGIVSRDRTDAPARGLYNICYINGFQVQPGEEDDWDADLLLRDESGDVIIDQDWDEALLDVSTDTKRERIAEVVGDWIRSCKADGFDAVEIDNLDTFSRSGDRISEDDAVAFVALLSQVAHAAGLAIAQKNAVELVPRRAQMGTDFVVAEECNAWNECDGYIDSYGPYVLMIEYARDDFEVGCAEYGTEFSVVLRDRNLTAPQSNAYLYDGC
jgi:Glycoside-hydrolase family GH114